MRDFFRPVQLKNGEWRFFVEPLSGHRFCPADGASLFEYAAIFFSPCLFRAGRCQHVTCWKRSQRKEKR